MIHHFSRLTRVAALAIGSVTLLAFAQLSATAAPSMTDAQVAGQVARAATEPDSRAASARILRESPEIAAYSDPALNERIIRKYSQYITHNARGEYVASLSFWDRWTDAEGTAAVTRAVSQSNSQVRASLQLLESQGKSSSVQDYRYGDPLPMGPHATFTPLWWGMVFTLDASAAKQVNDALVDTSLGLELVDIILGALGAVVAAPVKAAFAVVVRVMKWLAAVVKQCTTADGLVFKSLWVPIVWCERPTGKFEPAS